MEPEADASGDDNELQASVDIAYLKFAKMLLSGIDSEDAGGATPR